MDLLIKFCKYAGLDYTVPDSSSIVIKTNDVVTMCISLGSYITENSPNSFEVAVLRSSLMHFHIESFYRGVYYVRFYELEK